jgi:uncharacterized protein YciI
MTTMPPEVALTDLPGELLRARVARAQLYLIYAHGTGVSATPEAERSHLSYMESLDRLGRLFAYGALDQHPNSSALELAIIAASSGEEAERIAASDPLIKAGARKNQVQAHTMNEGVACYVGRAMSKRAQMASDSPDLAVANNSDSEPAGASQHPTVYLIYLDPTDTPRPPEDTATTNAHFVWLRENEMGAKLLSCGPVAAPSPLGPGIWGGGLGVVATSRADAEHIAAMEPSGQAGYRRLSVRGWTIASGLAKPIAQALLRLNTLTS